MIGLRDGRRYETHVVVLIRAAVAELDVGLLEVPQLGGRYGGRGSGGDS